MLDSGARIGPKVPRVGAGNGVEVEGKKDPERSAGGDPGRGESKDDDGEG